MRDLYWFGIAAVWLTGCVSLDEGDDSGGGSEPGTGGGGAECGDGNCGNGGIPGDGGGAGELPDGWLTEEGATGNGALDLPGTCGDTVLATIPYSYTPRNTRTQGSAEYASAAVEAGVTPAPNRILSRDFLNRFPPPLEPDPKDGGVALRVHVMPLPGEPDQPNEGASNRFLLQAAAVAPPTVDPSPLDLVILADTSASMAVPSDAGDGTTPMQRQLAFLGSMIDELSDQDRVTLLAWDSPVPLIQYTHGVDDQALLEAAIAELPSRQGEVEPSVLADAYSLFTATEGLPRLVVVSDGGFVLDEASYDSVISNAPNGPLFVGIGLGDPVAYLTSQLHDLARDAQGAHRYAATVDSARALAVDEFDALFQSAAETVEFEIQASGAVTFEFLQAESSESKVRKAGLGPGQIALLRRVVSLCDSPATLGQLDAGPEAMTMLVTLVVDGEPGPQQTVNLGELPPNIQPILHTDLVLLAADALTAPSPARLGAAAEALEGNDELTGLLSILKGHPNLNP